MVKLITKVKICIKASKNVDSAYNVVKRAVLHMSLAAWNVARMRSSSSVVAV
jgi:hypothetical protein